MLYLSELGSWWKRRSGLAAGCGVELIEVKGLTNFTLNVFLLGAKLINVFEHARYTVESRTAQILWFSILTLLNRNSKLFITLYISSRLQSAKQCLDGLHIGTQTIKYLFCSLQSISIFPPLLLYPLLQPLPLISKTYLLYIYQLIIMNYQLPLPHPSLNANFLNRVTLAQLPLDHLLIPLQLQPLILQFKVEHQRVLAFSFRQLIIFLLICVLMIMLDGVFVQLFLDLDHKAIKILYIIPVFLTFFIYAPSLRSPVSISFHVISLYCFVLYGLHIFDSIELRGPYLSVLLPLEFKYLFPTNWLFSLNIPHYNLQNVQRKPTSPKGCFYQSDKRIQMFETQAFLFMYPQMNLQSGQKLVFMFVRFIEQYNIMEGYMKSAQKLTLILLLTVVVQSHSQNSPSCPIGSSYLSLHHGHLSIGIGSSVSIQMGIDSLCFDHALPSPFQERPGVAIAISHFESNPSQELFFTIQTSKTQSLSVLSFMIRTQWKYTHWNLLTANFFAQNHQHYEANSFMVDTTPLAGCSRSKEVNVILPFKSSSFVASNAVAFLNGFEISTTGCQPGTAPFEVQVKKIGLQGNGVSLRITATTSTKIFNVFVSIIAWCQPATHVVGNTFEYNSFVPLSQSSSNTITLAYGSTHDTFGFSGFIVSNGKFLLSAKFINNAFSFVTATTFQYLSFSYFFISTPPCSDCPGYPYPYNGVCQASCPPGTYLSNGLCISCPVGQQWNGHSCVPVTPTCPPGQQWNGHSCVSITPQCPHGTVWNGTACCAQTPQCPHGQVWNGYSCVGSTPQCPPGQTWNGTHCCHSNSQCPPNTQWNGYTCVPYNCPHGTYWNGTACCSIPNCPPGTQWNGTACQGQIYPPNPPTCPPGQQWNGTACTITCSGGQYWCQQTHKCICALGQYWTGSSCVSCQQGKIWNEMTRSCMCPNGMHWSGSSCISCPHGQYWNGYTCIGCYGGQSWNTGLLMCECLNGQQWDGSKCIVPCPQGQIAVNGLCKCPPNTYLVNGQCVSTPQCPKYQKWNGHGCQPISCPPGYYWNGQMCTIQTQNCPAGTFFDGYSCVFEVNRCPQGTQWNGQICVTNYTKCSNGSYWTGSMCEMISCQCPPMMHWTNGKCIPIGNQCPPSTYFNGQQCVPTSPCKDGKIWDQSLSQCVCPHDSFWNGNLCVRCDGGQTYQGSGCYCPEGLFWDAPSRRCKPIDSTGCRGVQNSIWRSNQCSCMSGFFKEGQSCQCKGLVNNGMCDQCYMKPNSQWKYGICQCMGGYYEIQGQCRRYRRPLPPTPHKPRPPTGGRCKVGTFWDDQEQQCLPCSDGCLSCVSCYECIQCRPGYSYSPASKRCIQNCGDGLRFTLACDDNNNVDGDGCSSDCKLQPGYHCMGGSPSSKDSCTKYQPSKLVITQSGQSHLMNKIILNVRVNYLPQELLQSCVQGIKRGVNCEKVLDVEIVTGDKGCTSVKAKYIPTTSYSFSIELDFGREPIGMFTCKVGIHQMARKYYSGIDISERLAVDVNPAFLSVYTGSSPQKSKKEDTLE